MADSLLLHPKTRKQLAQIAKHPAHALLIYGPAGSGKQALAEYLSSLLLDIDPEKLSVYPHFIVIERPDSKQEIPIDLVRSVIRQLGLKTAIGAQKSVNRVVLINDAHLASAEAQNALLKAIEEPPLGTAFILTAISEQSVLPTISSRSEKLPLIPVSLDESRQYFSGLYDNAVIDSAWQLSGGSAGLLNALLRDNQSHRLKQSVDTAKQLLKLNAYERLMMLDKLSVNKADFRDFLEAMGRILASLNRSAINSGNHRQAKRLQSARKQVYSAINSVDKNTSVRLIALDIALSLPV